MSWLFLLLAGIFEIVWAIGFKLNAGDWTPGKLPAWGITAAAVVLSMYFLAVSMKEIPLGTAYAVWTGIGAVGAFIAGVLMFNEPASVQRITCVTLIVAGLIGLKLTSP